MLVVHVPIHTAQLLPLLQRYDSYILKCGFVFSTTPLIKTSSVSSLLDFGGGLPAGQREREREREKERGRKREREKEREGEREEN